METVLRGYHGKDAVQFGPKWEAKLNAAIQELFFLLNRGYDVKSASTFIGNHYLLSERQRLALARITSPETALQSRRAKELLQPPESLALDGFNTIITLEVARSPCCFWGWMAPSGTWRGCGEPTALWTKRKRR